MSALREILAGDPLLQVLLQLAAVAALTTAAFLLLVRCCRRPVLAHALAKSGLAALLLLPLPVVVVHQLGSGVALLPPAAPARVVATPGQGPPTTAPVQQEADAVEPEPQQQTERAAAAPSPTTTVQLPSPGALVLSAWLAAALFLLLRELHRYMRLCRVVRQAAAPADAALRLQVAGLSQAMQLRAPPRVVVLDQLGCPATLGVVRPTLLLPRALLGGQDHAAITAMLRHELAHLALGHHREGILQLLARSLFAWLPPAHALARALGRAQEQLADNAAMHADSDRLGYARTLLALAERAHAMHTPSPLWLSSLGDHELKHRITRLLSEDPDMTYRQSRRCRLAAAAGLLLAVAAPLPFRLLPAQVPPPPQTGAVQPAAPAPAQQPGPNSGVHFLPLGEGTTWTWHVTRKDGELTSERDETSRVWGMVPARDGSMVAQLQTTRGDHVSWDYRAAREDGVFSYQNSYLGGMRGAGRVDEKLLPAPVGAITQWEWDSQLSYQTMGNAPRPDPETERVHHVARLLGVDEKVTVPAGTFQAVHVQITASGAQNHTRDLWFARGVGLVRDEHRGPDTHQVRELTAFQPGAASPLGAEAALRAFRAATPAFAAAAVEWAPLGEEACYLRGRFAILRAGDTSICAHVGSGGVVTFAPDDQAFWTQQLQALAAERAPGAAAQRRAQPSDEMQATYLAGAAARLQALLQRCTDIKGGGTQSQHQLGARPWMQCVSSVRALDAAGKPVRVDANMRIEGTTITMLKVETTADEGRK